MSKRNLKILLTIALFALFFPQLAMAHNPMAAIGAKSSLLLVSVVLGFLLKRFVLGKLLPLPETYSKQSSVRIALLELGVIIISYFILALITQLLLVEVLSYWEHPQIILLVSDLALLIVTLLLNFALYFFFLFKRSVLASSARRRAIISIAYSFITPSCYAIISGLLGSGVYEQFGG
jgi:hypothetical protein